MIKPQIALKAHRPVCLAAPTKPSSFLSFLYPHLHSAVQKSDCPGQILVFPSVGWLGAISEESPENFPLYPTGSKWDCPDLELSLWAGKGWLTGTHWLNHWDKERVSVVPVGYTLNRDPRMHSTLESFHHHFCFMLTQCSLCFILILPDVDSLVII